MPIETITISRNDGFFESFPDLAQTATGTLLCVYRESDAHVCTEFTRIVVRRSEDMGRTWSEPAVLVDSAKADGVLTKWNCPRIQQLSDGRLLVVCDAFPVPSVGERWRSESVVHFLWSSDDGLTWSEPQPTPVRGIVPDRLVEQADGGWLLAIAAESPRYGTLRQTAFSSRDAGLSWDGPRVVCERPEYNSCEGSVVAFPDGLLVCYMRENSRKGIPALKAISPDHGISWDGPYETLMGGCHRPVAGILPSGRVLVTYRHFPGGAGVATNFFAYLEDAASAREPERMRQRGIVLPLDHDRSERPDHSYSGWTVLPSGKIFAVSYIMDDAPRAQIRGYFFEESDF